MSTNPSPEWPIRKSQERAHKAPNQPARTPVPTCLLVLMLKPIGGGSATRNPSADFQEIRRLVSSLAMLRKQFMNTPPKAVPEPARPT